MSEADDGPDTENHHSQDVQNLQVILPSENTDLENLWNSFTGHTHSSMLLE